MPRTAAARTAARAVAGAFGAAVVLAAPALANTTPLGTTAIQYADGSRSTCESPAFVHPYVGIGDRRTYVLAPGGSFSSSTAGWQLKDGARLVSDAARGTALGLPAGASAISPGMCVDLDYPHLRLAHKVVGKGASNIELLTEVVYPQLPAPEWTEVKQFDGWQGDAVGSGWRISPDIDLKPDFGGSTPGARYVALRFTAVKKARTAAEVRVDDVFIDPRMMR
jgi:hypothetical protein